MTLLTKRAAHILGILVGAASILGLALGGVSMLGRSTGEPRTAMTPTPGPASGVELAPTDGPTSGLAADTALPPIDAVASSQTKTATFALG